MDVRAFEGRWPSETEGLGLWHLLCAVLLVVAAGSEAEIRSRYQERAQRAVLALLQVIAEKVQKLQAMPLSSHELTELTEDFREARSEALESSWKLRVLKAGPGHSRDELIHDIIYGYILDMIHIVYSKIIS